MSLLRSTKSASRLYLLQTRATRTFRHSTRFNVPLTASKLINYKFIRHYNTIPDTKDADSIVKVLNQVQEDNKTATYYNDLLKHLAVDGRSVQAQKVYDKIFREHNVVADITTYSQLMLAYINDGKYEEAMEIYYELRDYEDSPNNSVKNLRLDADTYATMIESLVDPKNMSNNGYQFDATAEPLYEYSVEDVESAIYQDIEGDSQPALLTALTLFNDMRHLEIQPTPNMYVSMLKACAEQKDGYVLEKLHKLIRMDLYLDPDMRVFNHLMEAYRIVGDGASVLEIWDSASQFYDEKSVSIVLKTCLDYGYTSRSRAIYDALKSNQYKLSVDDFNNYLSCQLKSNTVEQLQHLVDQALLDGEANQSSVNLLDKYKQQINNV